jgi:hypothetical protein
VSIPGLESVRTELHRALGDERLTDVLPDDPLLRGGLISSIELVSILAHLENQFKVQLRHIMASQVTLATLASAVRGQPGAIPEHAVRLDGVTASLRRYLGRPVAALITVLCAFMLLDSAFGRLMNGAMARDYDKFLEDGRRLYPYTGAFSQDDFAFAVQHHEIARETSASRTWLMFGDSGTIGSFVSAEQSLPAQLEKRLVASGERVRVANLAWFGRFLVKDLMLLELVWSRRFDTAIFTIGDTYFDRNMSELWVSKYRHISVNLPLFSAFVKRVPPAEAGPFREMETLLERADVAHGGSARRWAFRNLGVVHYNPFIQYWLTVEMLPPLFGSVQRSDIEVRPKERFALASSAKGFACGVAPANVDERQIRILESTIALLRERGVRSVLYIEPCAPREWRDQVVTAGPGAAALVASLAARTGAAVIDLTWELGAADFIDSLAHYTPEGNRRLAAALDAGLASTSVQPQAALREK